MFSPRHKAPANHSVSAIVGVAALLVAGVGAVDLAREQDAAVATEPAAAVAHASASSPQEAYAARRAEVVEASRSGARTGLPPTQVQADRAADRGADARARALQELASAAEQRSAEIHRQQVRERERRRELARQRRIERMNRWVVPVSGYDITATFGAGGSLWSSDHTGLDFAAPSGSRVGSAAMGEVTSTGYDESYGNQVVVTHDDGTETWYCHLSSITVGVGESVSPGTMIGTVGSTGNSTGPHLHLEVRPGGDDPVDPYSYLQSQGANP